MLHKLKPRKGELFILLFALIFSFEKKYLLNYIYKLFYMYFLYKNDIFLYLKNLRNKCILELKNKQ